MSNPNAGRWIRGECLCHGVVVEGPIGTVAQPKPYWRNADPFGAGPSMRCVAVKSDGRGMPHDVPLVWAAGVERLTNERTVEIEPPEATR